MIVKAKTVYKPEMAKDFMRYYRKLPPTIGLILFWLLSIASLVYVCFVSKDVILVSIILFIFIVIALVTLGSKKAEDEFLMCMFEFSDDKAIIKVADVEKPEENYTPFDLSTVAEEYRNFNLVYETDEYFYFLMERHRRFEWYVLRKCDITEGSVTDLQDLLKNNLRAKKYVKPRVKRKRG